MIIMLMVPDVAMLLQVDVFCVNLGFHHTDVYCEVGDKAWNARMLMMHLINVNVGGNVLFSVTGQGLVDVGIQLFSEKNQKIVKR